MAFMKLGGGKKKDVTKPSDPPANPTNQPSESPTQAGDGQ